MYLTEENNIILDECCITQVFKMPLEKVEGFDNFVDFCSTFFLTHGKNIEDESDIVGEFKVNFRTTLVYL